MSSLIPKEPEKRYYKRLNYSLPVEIKSKNLHITAKTVNISCGGLFIEHPVDNLLRQQSDELQTFISLPDIDKKIRINGTIARIERDDLHKLQGIAIKFSGLYDDNLLLIDRFVKDRITSH